VHGSNFVGSGDEVNQHGAMLGMQMRRNRVPGMSGDAVPLTLS
jgi:hypothetical protein